MKYPEVSVVMPAFNRDEFIGEAIESVLFQTFSDFELLIIDDCSTDKTLEVIKQYSDKRIRIIQNASNIGVSASRNIGLHESKGKYLAWMDSDDISTPDRLEKLYGFLEKNSNIDICGSNLKMFGAQNYVSDYFEHHDEITSELIWTCSIPQGACMMRLDKLRENHLIYDMSYSIGEDWMFFMLGKDKLRFANLKDVLYHYRRGFQGMVLQAKNDLWKHNSLVYKALLSDFGIAFGEEELKLHCFILLKFNMLSPSPHVIRQARKWLTGLIQHNRKEKKYNEYVFETICEKKWEQLFYKLVPTGLQNVIAYFSAEGKISVKHFSYYSKYSINKYIGRYK